jgi:hypothetical protein
LLGAAAGAELLNFFPSIPLDTEALCCHHEARGQLSDYFSFPVIIPHPINFHIHQLQGQGSPFVLFVFCFWCFVF